MLKRLVGDKRFSFSGHCISYGEHEEWNGFCSSLIGLTPGVNVIKLFSSSLMMRPNKLECLYLAITFQSSLTFAGNTRSLPKKEASDRSSNWVSSGLAFKF
jgi:hypothetical protein